MVDRFDIEASMIFKRHGEYVSYSDYEALEKEKNELQSDKAGLEAELKVANDNLKEVEELLRLAQESALKS